MSSSDSQLEKWRQDERWRAALGLVAPLAAVFGLWIVRHFLIGEDTAPSEGTLVVTTLAAGAEVTAALLLMAHSYKAMSQGRVVRIGSWFVAGVGGYFALMALPALIPVGG